MNDWEEEIQKYKEKEKWWEIFFRYEKPILGLNCRLVRPGRYVISWGMVVVALITLMWMFGCPAIVICAVNSSVASYP
jgi:hypothetical protein